MNIKDAFTFYVGDQVGQTWARSTTNHTYSGTVTMELREGGTAAEAQRGRIIASTEAGTITHSTATELNNNEFSWALAGSVRPAPGAYWIAAKCIVNGKTKTFFSFLVTFTGEVVS